MKTISPHPMLWFILGREPRLSTVEILTILPTKKYFFDTHIFKAHTSLDPHELIQKLGGTIKIGEELGTNLTEEQLLELMLKELKTIEGKIHFGISLYKNEQGTINNEQKIVLEWGKRIKKLLKEEGYSVRYVENREPILSSVTVEKNGLTKRGREFLICTGDDRSGKKFSAPTPTTYSLAKTVVVQPFEEWSRRDFGRPGRDDKSGMLPPKLAAIMINLCRHVRVENFQPLPPRDFILLDPFCGSGTILTEAARLGFTHLVGTDISEKAIEDTRKNINWSGQYGQETKDKEHRSIKILQSDIKHLAEKISLSSIDTIVTEPYLGRPRTGRETWSDLEKQITELKNLYLGAFTVFHKILKPGGRIVFIIPRFKYRNEWLTINCTEEIKKRGFKIIPLLPESDFILYARPNQLVGREIWRFEKI